MICLSDVIDIAPKGNETLLHHKLKSLYCTDENIETEVIIKFDEQKFRLDVLNKERGIIYEIQRTSFGGRFSKKIQNLLNSTNYIIRIVHPILYKQKTSRMRKSERLSVSYRNFNTTILHLFDQLVYFKIPYQDRLQFDILLVNEYIRKEFVGYTKRSHRRKYKTKLRDLIEIVDKYKIRSKEDFLKLLPSNLPIQFSNQDLGGRLAFNNKRRRNERLPGKITYSLCQLRILKRVGKKGNAFLFQIA
jgi:hypothetical protein